MKDLGRITLAQIGKLVEQSADELKLAGQFKRTGNGGFALTFTAEPTGDAPPPDDAVILTPTGGDDTGLIQSAWNNLPSGKTLMLSGMFGVGSCLWLEGTDKTLCGDKAKRSGLFPLKDGGYSGHYGAMFCTKPQSLRLTMRDLEWDMGGKAVQPMFFDSGVDITLDHCYIHDIGWKGQGPPCAGVFSQAVAGLRVTNNKVERTGGTPGGDGIRGIWLPARSVHVEGNYVADTGHTCIAVESVNATVIKNTVERSTVQGTGMKACIRQYGRSTPTEHLWPLRYDEPAPVEQSGERAGEPNIYVAENTVNGTAGAGLMLQDIGNFIVLVEKNKYTNCGKQGTSFGALYNSNTANNVTFRQNRLENCRSIAGGLNFYNSRFEANEIVNMPDALWLEQNCRTIVLTQSGKANIGTNVSEVWVDGQKVA